MTKFQMLVLEGLAILIKLSMQGRRPLDSETEYLKRVREFIERENCYADL